ncbi:hypothetical protein KP509_1Z231300 [Ceratopteris richardii]|nr:hypothetical protein KP509_1Z231300 [Ceratopteris richardii]
MEEKKMNEQLKEQRKDLQSKILKKEELRRDQENEHSELCLNIKRLEKLESEGAGKFSQKLSSSLLWNKVSHEEKYGYESSCKKKEMEPPESTKDHKSIEDNLTGSKTSKVGLDKELEKSVEELKLLKKDMAKKNQQFLNLRHKVDELPTHLELMQYGIQYSLLITHKCMKSFKCSKHFIF